MNTKHQTAKVFQLDGASRLRDCEDVFVCASDGSVRLHDPHDPTESGGTEATTLVKAGDYIVEGTSRRPDVIVKVWQVVKISSDNSGQAAECRLSYTQAHVFDVVTGGYNEKPWRPQMTHETKLSRQLNSYSNALFWRLKPRQRIR